MLAREEQVEAHALRAQGWSVSAITRHLGRDRKTVRAYLSGERRPGVRRSTGEDPYARFKPYTRQRLKDDPHLQLRTLLRELEPLGFSGSYQTLTRAVRARSLRPHCERCAQAKGRATTEIEHDPVSRPSGTGWSSPRRRGEGRGSSWSEPWPTPARPEGSSPRPRTPPTSSPPWTRSSAAPAGQPQGRGGEGQRLLGPGLVANGGHHHPRAGPGFVGPVLRRRLRPPSPRARHRGHARRHRTSPPRAPPAVPRRGPDDPEGELGGPGVLRGQPVLGAAPVRERPGGGVLASRRAARGALLDLGRGDRDAPAPPSRRGGSGPAGGASGGPGTRGPSAVHHGPAVPAQGEPSALGGGQGTGRRAHRSPRAADPARGGRSPPVRGADAPCPMTVSTSASGSTWPT